MIVDQRDGPKSSGNSRNPYLNEMADPNSNQQLPAVPGPSQLGFFQPTGLGAGVGASPRPPTELDAPPAYTDEIPPPSEPRPVVNIKRSPPVQQQYTAASPSPGPSPSSNNPYAAPHFQQSSESSDNAFSRQAPQQSYTSFEPMFLIAQGQYLTRGFPAVPPPSRVSPHPFASHDVTESDWLRFLEEVKTAGGLTKNQEHMAHLPIVSIIPIVGSLTTHFIRQQMKKGKTKTVGNVVDLWNHHFFRPRHIEVALMCGMTRLSAKNSILRDESTPGWSGDALINLPGVESNGGKGKAKEVEDTTYRLCVMPLYPRN